MVQIAGSALIFGDPRVGTPLMVNHPSIALDEARVHRRCVAAIRMASSAWNGGESRLWRSIIYAGLL